MPSPGSATRWKLRLSPPPISGTAGGGVFLRLLDLIEPVGEVAQVLLELVELVRQLAGVLALARLLEAPMRLSSRSMRSEACCAAVRAAVASARA